jgi:hypothetical protein
MNKAKRRTTCSFEKGCVFTGKHTLSSCDCHDHDYAAHHESMYMGTVESFLQKFSSKTAFVYMNEHLS